MYTHTQSVIDHDRRQHEITALCIKEHRPSTAAEEQELADMLVPCPHKSTYLDVTGRAGFVNGEYSDNIKTVERCLHCGVVLPGPELAGPVMDIDF